MSTKKVIAINIVCISIYHLVMMLNWFGILILFWLGSIQLGRMLYKKYEGVEIIADLSTLVAALCCGPIIPIVGVMEYWYEIKRDLNLPSIRNPFTWKKENE